MPPTATSRTWQETKFFKDDERGPFAVKTRVGSRPRCALLAGNWRGEAKLPGLRVDAGVGETFSPQGLAQLQALEALKITLFIPCFVDLCYPRVGISMVAILERLGHTVDYGEELTCCGQPAFNSGYWDEARPIAKRVLNRLKSSDVVSSPPVHAGQ